jgi:probable phosphomutase (TIGR03848 family)
MTLILLVRHGRSSANSAGLLAGRMADVHLDDIGREQAAHVGARLAGVSVAEVVTSPLERCRETAKGLVAAMDRKPDIRADKRFVEVDYGDWSGKKLSTLAKRSLWTVVQEQPSAARFPGGESLAEVAARASLGTRAVVDRLGGPGSRKVAVIVSHGDVIKSILADALGMHLDLFQRIVVDPGSISAVRYTKQRPYVLSVNSREGSLGVATKPRRGPQSPVGGTTGR